MNASQKKAATTVALVMLGIVAMRYADRVAAKAGVSGVLNGSVIG